MQSLCVRAGVDVRVSVGVCVCVCVLVLDKVTHVGRTAEIRPGTLRGFSLRAFLCA